MAVGPGAGMCIAAPVACTVCVYVCLGGGAAALGAERDGRVVGCAG